MDDFEAQLTLAAGDPPERLRAREWLCDKYFEPLLTLLEDGFRIDGQFACTGAGLALDELCRRAADLAPGLEGRDHQPWRWLVRRGIARAIDERRKHWRRLTGNPLGRVARDAADLDGLEGAEDPARSLARAENAERLRELLACFVPSLDPRDRHILLHDLVSRHELLTGEEAEQLDGDYVARSHLDGIYTREQLKKRRQRLRRKLEHFLELQGIR